MTPSRLAEVWRHRELVRSFVVRNLKLKYKGSVLGFLWSFLTPLFQMIVYMAVFSMILRVKTEYPFPVFLLSGLLPWIFFLDPQGLAHLVRKRDGDLVEQVFPRGVGGHHGDGLAVVLQ